MKNTIKLLTLLLMISLGTTSFGQTFGIKGGLNLTTFTAKYLGEKVEDFEFKPGFHVGATLEFDINENFGFETGLLLSTKGARIESSLGEDYNFKQTTNIVNLDIPLNFKAYFGEGNTRFFGALGPYLGFAMSGKVEEEANIGGIVTEDDYDLEIGSDETDDIKALDFGLGFGLGVLFNQKVELGVTYNLGLTNLLPESDSDTSTKNSVIAVSLGYKFMR